MADPRDHLSASLYFSDGKSDKVYHVQVRERDPGWVLVFQFGRRGSALQSGTKTAKPVPLETATALFQKLVQEKLAKGYSPAEGGTPFQDTDKAGRITGVLPQLLNTLQEDEIESRLRDADWFCQQKLDGERRLLKRGADGVIGINRMGLEVALPQPVVDAVSALGEPAELVFDGEIIGHKVYVFDLLALGDEPVSAEPVWRRLDRLAGLLGSLPPQHGEALAGVTTARTEAEKRALLADLRAHGQEGIVFKRASAPYVHGRPISGGNQLKFKFAESATLLVGGVNGSRRSVELHGLDDAGNPVALGSVTIPVNFNVPTVGAIVEVRYLYAYPGGSLFQPVYRGERTDQPREACTTAQIKLKAAHKDVDGNPAAAA